MNASDILRYGHLTLLKSLDQVTETSTPGVCGIWSVKDIVAHLASYENMLTDVLNSVLDPATPIPVLKRMASPGFNDAEVAARQNHPWETVLEEYRTGYERNAALLEQIPVATRRQNGLLTWYGSDYDLEDFLVYTFYGHKREHAAQIMLYRDRLNSDLQS